MEPSSDADSTGHIHVSVICSFPKTSRRRFGSRWSLLVSHGTEENRLQPRSKEVEVIDFRVQREGRMSNACITSCHSRSDETFTTLVYYMVFFPLKPTL